MNNVYTDTLNNLYSQTGTFAAPVVKANQVVVNNFEKLIDLQMKSLQEYVEIGIGNMKAAAEVDSPSALQRYFGKQSETVNVLRQKMMNDVKALTELGTTFREDMTKLTEASIKDMKTATNKAAKKAA